MRGKRHVACICMELRLPHLKITITRHKIGRSANYNGVCRACASNYDLNEIIHHSISQLQAI
jgi:hypothetical protein